MKLIELLILQGTLSKNEAVSALRGYRQKRKQDYTSEAVGHYGGATKLIQDAVKNRRRLKKALERENEIFGSERKTK